MTIKPGQIHDQRYKFERIIGQGAFGVTWQGQQLKLQRPVAIKVIDAGQLDQSNLERVMRECQIGGRLQNSHIVNVFDAYEEGNNLCLVMEFMAGGSLKDYLARRQPTLTQGLQWGVDLAKALAAVHEQGIIHRDIKPANILLTEDNQVKIADFGIAHLRGAQLTGVQPGTPAYRAPEQADNQPVEAAADVYALSAVLFEIFSGEQFFPFKGIPQAEWPRELQRRLARRHFETAEPLLADLAGALAQGLAVDPATRISLVRLRRELANLLANLPAAAGAGVELAPPTLPPDSSPGETPREQTPLSRIGPYEVQALIGRGGMGSVYKAYDPRLDRLVALKTITIVDPSWRARFQREARIAGRLNHPHIVTVYDVGEVKEMAYIVMELIEGQTLADLQPSRLAWPEAINLLLPICRALDYAHEQGIIHRDIKPANILLAADGRVKLTDFGVARLDTTQQLTSAGAVIGTLLYMAPEQLAGQSVDRRADLYALGVILFELIAGQHPFLDKADSRDLNLLSRPRSPDFSRLAELAPLPLQAVVQQAMAEAPADRFATVAGLAEALRVILSQASTPGRPVVGRPTEPVEMGLPPLEIAPEVALSPDEQALVTKAFSGHDRVYIEGELSRPTPRSGGATGGEARLLVALPVRSGLSLARVIIKLASPDILSREWTAYQKHVAEILPLVTAHIQGAPLLSPDRKQALLRYTFAGDVGEHRAVSLAEYYQTHPGPEVATLLERNLFQVVAPNWWLDRATHRFLLGQAYDHLLPVHLVVERAALEDETPLLALKAGSLTTREVRALEVGRKVQIQGFRVQAVEPGAMILETRPATGSHAERLRLQLTGLSPDELRYQPGDLAPNFGGTIIAARPWLLAQAVEAALPEADLAASMIAFGASQVPNPLRLYEQYLERPVTGMRSIIHGHLTLENILVEPESGLAWLIDFANTRQGHNLYDFIQLETEIMTRLLPALAAEASLDLTEEVIAMARSLHTAAPPPEAPHPFLQKPYDLLRTLRRLAGQCMLDPDRWAEYYLGLTVMLLGTLPALQTDSTAIRLAFAWAAVTGELVDRPLRLPPPPPPPPPLPKPFTQYVWPALGVVGLVIILLTVGLLIWPNELRDWVTSLLFTPTPTRLPIAAVTPSLTPTPIATSTPTPSPTPIFTFTLTPTPPPSPTAAPTFTPGPAWGILTAALPVYSGPGTTYPPVGNIANGTEVQVVGRNLNGDWWQIEWPGGSGWVDANFVEVEGQAIAVLPPVTPSPPPLFTPTPTNTPTPVPPTPTITNTPTPAGSPTPKPDDCCVLLVNDTDGYRVLDHQAMGPNDPSSAAFSPDGSLIAATEGIRMYTINRDGSGPHIWMEEDDLIRPVEGIVWSPNGRYFAFVADRKRDCAFPCRRVAVAVVSTQQIFYLEPPEGRSIGLPRWLQDGRLMVTIYPDDPANGVTYIYDTTGAGRPAEAGTVYVLSSNHKGQVWHPWQPGRTWRADPAQPHRYYDD